MFSVISLGVLGSEKLIPKVSPKRLVLRGGLVTAAGLVMPAQLPTRSAYVAHILAPTLIVGAGMSVIMMPAIVAAHHSHSHGRAPVVHGYHAPCSSSPR